MGASRRRRSDRAGRGPIRSPGCPTAGRREHRQRFWKAIARGVSSWDAAREAGVSQPVGTRWFRENGGMPPTNLTPLSGHYLSFAEREEIALLRVQKVGVREIARRIDRAPSTISRELRRNAATRSGYLNIVRQRHSGTQSGSPSDRMCEARRQRGTAAVRPGAAGRHDCRWQRCDDRPRCELERSSSRSPPGSALGDVVESRADRSTAETRLPG